MLERPLYFIRWKACQRATTTTLTVLNNVRFRALHYLMMSSISRHNWQSDLFSLYSIFTNSHRMWSLLSNTKIRKIQIVLLYKNQHKYQVIRGFGQWLANAMHAFSHSIFIYIFIKNLYWSDLKNMISDFYQLPSAFFFFLARPSALFGFFSELTTIIVGDEFNKIYIMEFESQIKLTFIALKPKFWRSVCHFIFLYMRLRSLYLIT